MTFRKRRQLRTSVAALSLFLVSGLCADGVLAQSPSPTVKLTINANVQLTNLHPAVAYARLECSANFQYPGAKTGNTQVPITNRGFSGTVSVAMDISKSVYLSTPASRTVPVSCRLIFRNANGDSLPPAATAAQPESILPSNWNVVATGSTLFKSQSVTFPNVAP